MGDILSISLLSFGFLLVSSIAVVLYKIWWRPMKIEKHLKKQGINGPPYRLFHGNLKENVALNMQARTKPMSLCHEILPRAAPLLYETVKNYGKLSVTWTGPTPNLNIMDPEMIKEVLLNKLGHFVKPPLSPLTKLLAEGLVSHDGEKWAKHRRIINPAFHLEKLKRMLPAFSTCCDELISRWDNLVGSEGSHQLDVWPEFQDLTADVISRTAFGSNYEEGRRVFQLQTEQAELVMQAAETVYIPGFRFVPTKKNRRRKEINQEVRAIVTDMIKKREQAMKMGDANNDDLLGLLMGSSFIDSQEHTNSNSGGMTTEDVIEECKLFYFAGQETTSVLLTWTMVLLSMNPTWQQNAREEVLEIFGRNKPDIDGLNRLKIVTIILYEVLRLYPPLTFLVRHTCKRVKLGGIDLPPRVQLTLPTMFIHRDHELWGDDAYEFKPERFSAGVSKASKNQVAFFPFGWGPRICIGQSFAMIEVKLALAMILQHFSFELSPTYTHAPAPVVTLQPQHGAQIILHEL